MKRTKRTAMASEVLGAGPLRMSEPAERLRWAVEEHDKLLGRVVRKRKELERLEQDIRAAVTRVASHLGPLAEEARRLEEEIHTRLDALAAAKQRPRREREQIRRVHRDLEEAGVLSPRGAAEPVFGRGDRGDGPFGSGNDGDVFARDAAVRPKETERGALRDLFRRLAETLHPDKVQDEEEKAIRTEVMKEITVAYRERDFARLVEIERASAVSARVAYGDRGDETGRRHEALAEAADELRKQLRAMERQLRRLRASEEGRLANTLKRQGRQSDDGGLGSVVGPAEKEVEQLRRIHDFVEVFAEGKITLAEFLAGPAPAGAVEDDLSVILEEALSQLASMLEFPPTTHRRRGRGTGPNAKRGRRQA